MSGVTMRHGLIHHVSSIWGCAAATGESASSATSTCSTDRRISTSIWGPDVTRGLYQCVTRRRPGQGQQLGQRALGEHLRGWRDARERPARPHLDERVGERGRDRKSTRLNSSHVKISYAVFCLKKKT